jgi:hypothetical protein
VVLPILLVGAVAALAQPTAPLAASEPGGGGGSPGLDPGVFQPFVAGLLGKYGWLTTVLLAIDSLRILFKPIMLVVENALKNDPAKFAAVQKFEAGPIYKTIATVLDVGASWIRSNLDHGRSLSNLTVCSNMNNDQIVTRASLPLKRVAPFCRVVLLGKLRPLR